MNIELTEKEKKFLSDFAQKQCAGSKDNLGTMTPIHVVERKRKEVIDCPDGEQWLLIDDCYSDVFNDFDTMLEHIIEKETDMELPAYKVVEGKDINGIYIIDEKDYCKAFEINAYRCSVVESYEPVAFFFILDEAKRYKEGYQSHNCENCRIFTYGLG